MNILTPEVRGRIVAEVQDMLRRNPPPAGLTEQGFIEYINALIRYRLKNPLDDAPPKFPVLGGIGVADGLGDLASIIYYLFLESGWVHLSILSEPYPVGTVYYTDPLKDAHADKASTNPYLDKVWFQSDPELWEARDYTSGMDSLAFPADHNKQAFIAENHGCQTGKLKKFVQCMAGSIKSPSTLMETIQGPFDSNNSIILHTTDLPEYYFLKITRTGLSYAPVEFSHKGDLLLIELQTVGGRPDQVDVNGDATEISKREGYLFSDYDDQDELVWLGIDTWPEITGDEIYHGWAANQDGTEATIVTHERLYAAGHQGEADYQTGLEARRYTLTITSSGSGAGISFSVALVETESVTYGIEVGKESIWIPNVEGDNLTYWYPREQLGGMALPAADAPIYAWYTHDGLYQLRHYRSALQPNVPNTPVALSTWIANLNYCAIGDHRESWYSGVTGAQTQGFYIDGPDGLGKEKIPEVFATGQRYDNRLNYYHGENKNWCWSRNGTAPLSICGTYWASAWLSIGGLAALYSIDDQCATNTKYINTIKGYVNYRVKHYQNTGVSAESAVIFPWHNAESVLVYFKEHQSAAGNVAWRHRDTYGPSESSHVGTQAAHPEWSALDTVVQEDWIKASRSGYFHQSFGYTRGGTALTTGTATNNYTVLTGYYAGAADKVLEVLSEEGDSISTGIYDAVFDPLVFGGSPYPYVDMKVATQQSHGGEYLTHGDIRTPTIEVSDTIGDVQETEILNGIFEGWS